MNMGNDLTAPMISVVIPLYNGYEKITKCIHHLDKQTIQIPYEVLIIDDASPDHSGEKLTKMIQELDNPDRFLIVRCKENGRAGTARNIGIHYSRGKYIVFVDQDDYPDYKMLEVLYGLIEDGKYDCSSCDIVDKTGSEYHRYPATFKDKLTRQEKIDIMQHFGYVFAVLIKRQILVENNLIFPEKVMFEDSLYNFGVIAGISSMNNTNQTLYYRNDDENSQTAYLTLKKLKDRVRATEDYLLRYQENPNIREYMFIIKQYAFYYIYLSCIWWMIADKNLYDKDFFAQCVEKGHKLDVDWEAVYKSQSYFGKTKLRILKVIYDAPWVTPYIKKSVLIAKKIKRIGTVEQ